MNRILLIIIYLVLSTNMIYGKTEVRAYTDRNTVGLDEEFYLTIEVSGDNTERVSAPALPSMPFTNLGVSESSSSSISIINGKMNSNTTKLFNYTLRTTKVGTATIPAIKVGSFMTSPLTINVVKGATSQSRSNRNQNQNYTQKDYSSNNKVNTFIVAEVSKTSVYQGETIVVNYRLYTQNNIVNAAFGPEPEYRNFWKEDLFTAKNLSFQRTTYQGKPYNTLLMRTISLSPTKTGTLTVPVLTVNAQISVPSRSFFSFDRTEEIVVSGNPVSVHVKELPACDKDSFKGAVGKFDISGRIGTDNLKTGDSFTYTLTLSGQGNFNQILSPTFPSLPNFRSMDPEISTPNGRQKTFKYLVFAQEEGDVILPGIEFTYFDPGNGKFVTKTTESFKISVGKGKNSGLMTNSAQSEVGYEGKDIGFIITDSNLKSYQVYFLHWWYWLIFGLILLTIPLTLKYSKHLLMLQTDNVYMRNRQADKVLKKYLKSAMESSKYGKSDFYVYAQNGLNNYLTDKFVISKSSTNEEIIEYLKANNNMAIANLLTDFNNKCNQARFMPGGFSKENISADYLVLKDILARITKMNLRRSE